MQAVNATPALPADSNRPRCQKCRGTIVNEVRNCGLLFAELVHPADQPIRRHTHGSAFYHLTLRGAFNESNARTMVCFPPFTSAFTRSDTTHHGRVASSGTHIFTLEIDAAWMREFLQLQSEPDSITDCNGGALTCLGLRLYHEYQQGAAASPLTRDALVWELLGTAAKLKQHLASKPPNWWARIIDLLQHEFDRTIRIGDLAREANVHPVYLARVFRRCAGQTPGEWLQRVRVNAACKRLARGDSNIAEIAAEVGFADQSHLTRTFRRYTQLTPTIFRQLARRTLARSPE